MLIIVVNFISSLWTILFLLLYARLKLGCNRIEPHYLGVWIDWDDLVHGQASLILKIVFAVYKVLSYFVFVTVFLVAVALLFSEDTKYFALRVIGGLWGLSVAVITGIGILIRDAIYEEHRKTILSNALFLMVMAFGLFGVYWAHSSLQNINRLK